MSDYQFTISAFGDEIDQDLETQLMHLTDLQVNYLEFRSAWGINVADLTDDQVKQVANLLALYNTHVSALGSPVGKTPILEPLNKEITRIKRVFEIGTKLGTKYIRIFSFYPPEPGQADNYLNPSIERLNTLTELAANAGFTLLLENDAGLIADTPERCLTVLETINNPHLRLAWDGANFVHSGVSAPTTGHWDKLAPYVGTVHIKDMRAADMSKRAAGEGDAEMPALLDKLAVSGYRGFLAVEPHPYEVDGMGTLSGPQGMTYAVKALRKLLQKGNYEEKPHLA